MLHHIRIYRKCEWYHGIKTTYHRQICDAIRPVDYNFLRQFLIYDLDCASVASLEFKGAELSQSNNLKDRVRKTVLSGTVNAFGGKT